MPSKYGFGNTRKSPKKMKRSAYKAVESDESKARAISETEDLAKMSRETSYNPRTRWGGRELYDAYRTRVSRGVGSGRYAESDRPMSRDRFVSQQHRYSKSGEAGYVGSEELEKISLLGGTSAMTKKSSGFKMKGFSGFKNKK
tara:strand:+ start:70 stop:498 length:429 start_codon:yes stop_codon:yes gene_type:complete